jgi:SAM-dependent methyltransferase
MPVSYPADAPVLDVGCGNGQRLLELEDLGCSALLGIEPSAGAAEQARRHTRADIRTGLLEEAGLPDGHFQLVIMNQVLEHVPSPTATLSEAYRLLRHGGTLYLTVPNFGSFEARMFGPYWSGLQVPAHLHHFTAEPLKRLLTQAGFRISMLRTDTTLAVTEASVEDWSRARPSRWRVAVSRLPRVLYLPITLGVDLLGRGQMLRIVAQKD